jgi:hypothetical protein
VAAIRGMGFEVFDSENKAHLAQPCAKLLLASCSAYGARPNNCRTFRCRVLQRLEAGELSTEQAHALVNQAKSHSHLGKQAALLQRLIDTEFRTTQLRALNPRMDDPTAK